VTNVLQLNKILRDEVEVSLTFVGFLVFHCPLKSDAVETIRMLNDSSHRVSHVWTHFIVAFSRCFVVYHDHR
jgi:hypothetical protein